MRTSLYVAILAFILCSFYSGIAIESDNFFYSKDGNKLNYIINKSACIITSLDDIYLNQADIKEYCTDITVIGPKYIICYPTDFENLKKYCQRKKIHFQYAVSDGSNIAFPYDKLVGKVDKTQKNNFISILKSRDYINISINDKGNFSCNVPYNKDVMLEAKSLYELKIAEFIQPDFFVKVNKNSFYPTDPYFTKQFYLHNTGQIINSNAGTSDIDMNIPEAWDITKGSSDVKVAIIDDGIDGSHTDIPTSKILAIAGCNISYHIDATDPDEYTPQYPNEPHGTQLAGIIIATHDNDEGIAGIAPNVKLMPIRVKLKTIVNQDDDEFSSLHDFAKAVEFAYDNDADVILMAITASIDDSWFALLNGNIEEAITLGRGGLGIPVVICAGNGGIAIPMLPNNLTPTYKHKGLIIVGASDFNGNRASYSSTGANLDVSAPSATVKISTTALGDVPNVWTTDRVGNNGWNPWPLSTTPDISNGTLLPNDELNYKNYTGYFGGTSAASAMTAGVIALIISYNPCMKAEEIENVLKSTAKKTGGYNYNHDVNRPGHSLQLGYGIINAFGALRESKLIQNITLASNVSSDRKSLYDLKAGYDVDVNNTFGNVLIQSGAYTVKFLAVHEIKLMPGFSTQTNSNFNAKIINLFPNCESWNSALAPEFDTDITVDETKSTNVRNFQGQVNNGTNLYHVYPNPAQDVLNIDILNKETSQIKISIFDLLGHLVYSNLNINEELSLIKIDLKDFKEGLYFVRIQNTQTYNIVHFEKFVVIR